MNQACITNNASTATDLRSALAEKIPKVQEEVKAFRKEYGNVKVGEITVDMMYGGMRSMKGLVTETSVLDADAASAEQDRRAEDPVADHADQQLPAMRLLDHRFDGHADDLGKTILADVRKFANGHPQNDDITIMVFGRK